MSTRLLIIDQHALTRNAIRTLLTDHPEIDPIDDADSLDAGIYQAHGDSPDVILLGLPLGTFVGHAVHQLHQAAPNASVIMLTLHDDPAYHDAALAAGARACLQKDTLDSSLAATIQDADGAATGDEL